MISKSIRLQIFNLFFSLMPLTSWYRLRATLLKLSGIDCSESVRVVSSARIVTNNLSIGENTFIGHQVLIAGSIEGHISIGRYVDIGPRVVIVSGTHKIDMMGLRAAGEGLGVNVSIGDGVWIGANSTILPGVKIGEKAVIGAGSVVVSDIPAMSVSVGNPCKPIKIWSKNELEFKSLKTEV
jgi:maltose O-acetyltransferase